MSPFEVHTQQEPSGRSSDRVKLQLGGYRGGLVLLATCIAVYASPRIITDLTSQAFPDLGHPLSLALIASSIAGLLIGAASRKPGLGLSIAQYLLATTLAGAALVAA